MARSDTAVVVPVFNEEETVAAVVSNLLEEFALVVCVDDGSRDDSVAVARAAGAHVVRHAVNRGQGSALQTGFEYVLRHTDAEYCVTFDADGQHLVSDAVRMVQRAEETGVDVVLGSRFTGTTEAMPWLRGLVLRGGIWFTRWTAGLDVTDTHNGLRVLRRTALCKIHLRLPRMAYASELLSAIVPAGLSWVEEPVSVIYTDYSMTKGQRNANAINILLDLAGHRLRAAS